jgi:D-3-phosphoglycerate dehydrogenase
MNNKPLVVICDGMQSKLFEELKTFSNLTVADKAQHTREEILSFGSKAHALVVRSATKVDKALIDNMPNLKLVIRAGEGMDNIDIPYAQSKGIKATNTPGANGNAAAELAVSMMMALLRHIPFVQTSMQQGKWDKKSFVGNELTHKKIGILGFGKIGQTVAKRLQGFDVEIFYYDPMTNLGAPYKKCSTIEEVLKVSDIVSLHLPLIPETKNLLNYGLISKMKKTSYLVNCARGGVIVEADLMRALNEGIIAGAGLDVFETEPLPENSPLRNCPKLLLTPHLGASTQEAEWRVGEMVLKILKESF